MPDTLSIYKGQVPATVRPIPWMVFRINEGDFRPRELRAGDVWTGWSDQVDELGVVYATSRDEANARAIEAYPQDSLFCHSVVALVTEGYRSERVGPNGLIT
jgi:hypothetical protein